MNIAFTFDLENDANLSSNYGITMGLDKILDILKKYSIKSTFFVTQNIAQNFPELIRKLSQNNEIGSHGHIHKKYKKFNDLDKKGIENSKLLLEEITGKEILGFRAPFLYTNLELYKALKELKFIYDASGKPNSNLESIYGLKIFKVSSLNVKFRFPFNNRGFKSKFFQDTLSVLYFHPWEAIDMKKMFLQKKSMYNIMFRPDRWLNTGANFLKKFEDLIRFLVDKQVKFRLLKEMV